MGILQPTIGTSNNEKCGLTQAPPEQNPLIQDLHDFRVQIDSCIKIAALFKLQPNQEARYVNQGKMQREIALLYTKLLEAKMWAGKCLEAIGSPFPAHLRDEAYESNSIKTETRT